MRKERFKRICGTLLLGTVILAACVAFAGCGIDDIDVSGYQDQTIELAGLQDGQIDVTIGELKALDCVTKKTESTSDKIGKVKATGPLLDTLLAKYGRTTDQFSYVRITGTDGYDIKLNRDYLKEHQVILAFGIDGEPLDEESAPLRIVIPESDSAYWVRKVQKLDFVTE